MHRKHGHRNIKILEMSTEGGPSRITVFNKYSPSIAKLWKQKDRMNRNSFKGAQVKLNQEKEMALKEFERAKILLLRDRGRPSCPSSRPSSSWGPQEFGTRDFSQRRPNSTKPRPGSFPGQIEGLSESLSSLSVRREATFCRSLNQVCNATETEKRNWDSQVIRQNQVSTLEDDRKELAVPIRRKKTRDRKQRSLKCKSEAFPEKAPAAESLLSSKSLIMASSVFLTSSQSFQSEVPRYVRRRGGDNQNPRHSRSLILKSSSSEIVTPIPAVGRERQTPISSSVPEEAYLPSDSYNPEEYLTASEEDLSVDSFVKRSPLKTLSNTFSSLEIRRKR